MRFLVLEPSPRVAIQYRVSFLIGNLISTIVWFRMGTQPMYKNCSRACLRMLNMKRAHVYFLEPLFLSRFNLELYTTFYLYQSIQGSTSLKGPTSQSFMQVGPSRLTTLRDLVHALDFYLFVADIASFHTSHFKQEKAIWFSGAIFDCPLFSLLKIPTFSLDWTFAELTLLEHGFSSFAN